MSEKTKWTVDTTCKLIELYRETPLLWDSTNCDYKNRYKKAEALKEIGRSMNVTAEEIERKIKNINSQYQRERRNYKQCEESDSGKKFISKWFGYTLLSFLKDKNKPRKFEDDGGFHLETQQFDESNNFEEEEEEKIEVISNDNYNIDVATEVNAVRNEVPLQYVDKRCEEIYSMIKSVPHDQQENRRAHLDDFDVFGEIVARKLRKLPTRYAQITLQHLINNILYEGELGKYDEPKQLKISHGHQEFS